MSVTQRKRLTRWSQNGTGYGAGTLVHIRDRRSDPPIDCNTPSRRRASTPSLSLRFLQRPPSAVYAMMESRMCLTGRAPGREETRWTLSPWWIR